MRSVLRLGQAITLAAVFALPATSWGDSSGSPAWETLRNEDGIVASRREVPGSRFVAFRGEGDVDAPLMRVASVLVDIDRGHEWIDSVADARILRKITATEYITYSHVATPPTMSDRDFVMDVKLELDPANRTLAVRMRSVDDPSAPKTHYVRGDMDVSTFVLTPSADGARTHVVAEIHCDPKGNVAGWIVNWFQRNWGYSTIRSLRRQVPKPDVTEHQELKALLQEKGFFQ
ncbi:MAG: START domain-containing protein [Polyangiaceae bacterium]